MTALIPTVQWAHRAYEQARGFVGGSDSKGIDEARQWFGYHIRSSGPPHYFTDDEIRAGVCGCDECAVTGQMEMELEANL